MASFYGYIRVSTATQVEKGFGLNVQENAIREYAAQHNIILARVVADEGISGTTETRPGLDDLLANLAEGDTIIVHSTSRLWRDIFAQATILKAVMGAKANIISIDDPAFDVYRYMTDPNNFMVSGLLGMLDQWERMTIARKLARGRATKAAEGDKPAGVCPYGYQYAADKKSVVVVEDEAATVRKMYTLAQTGASLSTIVETLNADGTTTRRGNEWSRAGVAKILHNRFYIGELAHAGETITGNHAPIISKVQYGKVQAQLSKAAKR